MNKKITQFNKEQLNQSLPNIRSGDTVRIHQKIKEKKKERVQVFEGLVLAKKHGTGKSSTLTIRKVVAGVGVERVFPLHSPNIEKIEVVKRGKVRRAKLYYLRGAKGKRARLKKIDFKQVMPEEKAEESIQAGKKTEEPKEKTTEKESGEKEPETSEKESN